MLLQQVVNGITQGSTYALVAIGFALIFGVLGLIQFSHGEVYMAGAYLGHVVAVGTAVAGGFMGINVVAALLAAVVGAGALGLLIERVGFRPLRHAAPIASCLATIGISIILKDLARLVFGAQTRRFMAEQVWSRSFELGPVRISTAQIIILVVSALLILALQLILYRTRTGRAIRALAQDPMAAQLMGIPVNRVIAASFALGSALGGAAGALIGLYYNAVFPVMGFLTGIKAFAATVLGGLTSIPGAAVGGMVLGLAENMGSALIGEGWRDGIAFLILFTMLVLRPSGLFGTQGGTRA